MNFGANRRDCPGKRQSRKATLLLVKRGALDYSHGLQMHKEIGMRLNTWRGSLALAFIALLAAAAAARAETWNIDPVHTTVEFSVRHMMVSNVKGQFEKVSGTIAANGNDPNSVQINAVIDATSINTRVEKRDAHLKSAAFLEVDKYPIITFKSSKVEPDGANKWKVTGDLTLHGVTKPVVLEVETSAPVKDPSGKTRAGASATTKIDRKDFGVVWNKPMETGGVLVGDEVSIAIEVEAVQQ
jgi:polyisoprenoid-binding protein YceI